MHRQYQKQFRVAYHESTQKLYVTIPDTITWPSDMAWVWLRDNNHIVMSIDKPATTVDAQHVRLARQENLPGCRYFYLGPITHGMGQPFRVKVTQYAKLDESDSLRYKIFIPEPSFRKEPKRRKPVEPIKTFELLPEGVEAETERVTIEGFGSSWRFHLTIEQTLELTAYANRLAHTDT